MLPWPGGVTISREMSAGSAVSFSVHGGGIVLKPLTVTLTGPSWHSGRELTAQSELPSKPPTASVMTVGAEVDEEPRVFLTSWPLPNEPKVNAIWVPSGAQTQFRLPSLVFVLFGSLLNSARPLLAELVLAVHRSAV